MNEFLCMLSCSCLSWLPCLVDWHLVDWCLVDWHSLYCPTAPSNTVYVLLPGACACANSTCADWRLFPVSVCLSICLSLCLFFSAAHSDRKGDYYLPVGLNQVPNFAEYRVFEAPFAEYRVPIPSIWQSVNILTVLILWIISTKIMIKWIRCFVVLMSLVIHTVYISYY